MSAQFDRRTFVQTLAGASAGLFVAPRLLAQPKGKQPPKEKPLGSEQVHDFVRVAHGDLAKTQSMLDREPRLVRSTWDWGGGDFESALGAAGHMGRRDIALLLLDHGAPMELCAAAMLGETAIVEAALETRPSLFHVAGPHGIPLIAHARRGGKAAVEVLAFLEDFEQRHPA